MPRERCRDVGKGSEVVRVRYKGAGAAAGGGGFDVCDFYGGGGSRGLRKEWVWTWLAAMHVLASTVPRAIVMWKEPDVWESGDMELVAAEMEA